VAKPNAFTMKPQIADFIKKTRKSESSRVNGLKLNENNSMPFHPKLDQAPKAPKQP
jgi:hypothetical protein